MFESVVMGFFIGVPLLLMLGAFIAWLYQRNQTYTLED